MHELDYDLRLGKAANLGFPERDGNCFPCEALACGGFVLTNYTADLEDAGFRDGKSIAWFKSYEEMAYKASYYITNSDSRKHIAQNGRELVLNTLTYERISRDWMRWMESVCSPP